MSARLKSLLLLFAALLLGGVLGALVNARLAEARLEQVASLRSSSGFVRFVERGIEPRDEAQREAIRAVLQRSAEQLAETRNQHRQEVRRIVEATRAELAPLLTADQRAQLEARLEVHNDRPGGRERRRDRGRHRAPAERSPADSLPSPPRR